MTKLSLRLLGCVVAGSIATTMFAAADGGVKAADGPSGTVLATLGTAAGILPRKDRMQSSNLLVVNGTLYLIDTGGGVAHRLVEAGYDFRKANKVFITHAHSDRTSGLATLLVSEWQLQAPLLSIFTEAVSTP